MGWMDGMGWDGTVIIGLLRAPSVGPCLFGRWNGDSPNVLLVQNSPNGDSPNVIGSPNAIVQT